LGDERAAAAAAMAAYPIPAPPRALFTADFVTGANATGSVFSGRSCGGGCASDATADAASAAATAPRERPMVDRRGRGSGDCAPDGGRGAAARDDDEDPPTNCMPADAAGTALAPMADKCRFRGEIVDGGGNIG
jgi:hypothetical protein